MKNYISKGYNYERVYLCFGSNFVFIGAGIFI